MISNLCFPSSHNFLSVLRYVLRLVRVSDNGIVAIAYSSRSHLVFILQFIYYRDALYVV